MFIASHANVSWNWVQQKFNAVFNAVCVLNSSNICWSGGPFLVLKVCGIYIHFSQKEHNNRTLFVVLVMPSPMIAIFCFPPNWLSVSMILLKREWKVVEKQLKSFHACALVYVKRHPHAFQLNLGFSPLRNVDIYNLRTKYFDSEHQHMTAYSNSNELKWLKRVGRLFNRFLVNFPLLDHYFWEMAGFRAEILLFSPAIVRYCSKVLSHSHVTGLLLGFLL